jgi:hypothetical protein
LGLASQFVAACAYIIVPAVVGRLLKIDIAGVACTKRIVDREAVENCEVLTGFTGSKAATVPVIGSVMRGDAASG